MQVKAGMRATRRALREIIQRHFAGSQNAFSRRCRLDSADTSRVVNGIRPATVEIVGRATAALDEAAASALVAAFLSDIVAALPRPYSIVVRPASIRGRNRSTTRGRSRSSHLELSC